jgi:hypothetical protein
MTIWQLLTQAARNAAAQTFGKHPFWHGTLWGIAVAYLVLSFAWGI